MLGILIQKELKAILLSPKFVATFATCAVLILLSVFVGIQEYHAAVKQYDAAVQLAEQDLREASSWMSINNKVYRKPDPMQIFVSGVNNDIGRLSSVSNFDGIKLRSSIYSTDTIFAVFRYVDFVFIVQVVLSLFAILFTYDAVNGEREAGTLQLTFSNAVPRAQYILAKFFGSWLGLVVPLLIPIMLGILLVMLYRVPMLSVHWAKLGTLLGVSILFFTFFMAFGILVSTLTRQSAVSFLISLVAWVAFVLIVPRAGVMAAGQLVSVPTVAEIEGQQDGFEKAQWEKHRQDMQEKWHQREAAMQGMSEKEREAYRDDHEWEWLEEDDKDRKQMQKDINAFSQQLNEEARNRKSEQQRLAFSLSRFSPASAYQLAALNLAGTDAGLKTRYEDAMQNYRTEFTEYADKKQKKSGGMGGFRIEFNSNTGVKIGSDRDKGTLDLSDMPKFTPPEHTYAAALAPTLIDFGLLGLYTLAAFAGAFVRFLRYDVR
jgi:ABC-2 type transport system permease protein